jgi:undecaprenyl-diphosphatase
MGNADGTLLALLQGVTELFAVSSLGHTVIIPAAIGLVVNPALARILPILLVKTGAAEALYRWRSRVKAGDRGGHGKLI